MDTQQSVTITRSPSVLPLAVVTISEEFSEWAEMCLQEVSTRMHLQFEECYEYTRGPRTFFVACIDSNDEAEKIKDLARYLLEVEYQA